MCSAVCTLKNEGRALTRIGECCIVVEIIDLSELSEMELHISIDCARQCVPHKMGEVPLPGLEEYWNPIKSIDLSELFDIELHISIGYVW